MREQCFDLFLQFAHGRIHFARESLDEMQLVGGFAVGFEAGDGFDAADAGGDGAFADDAEQANLAGGAGVRAAAEFHASNR